MGFHPPLYLNSLPHSFYYEQRLYGARRAGRA
jgi:hypothetical protein